MNTRHGHHIPGTIKDETRPKFVKRCGGVNHCRQCTTEWEDWFNMTQSKVEFVGEVPLKDRPGGKIIGTAKIEKLSTGSLVFHANVTDPDTNVIMDGFSIGSFSIAEE